MSYTLINGNSDVMTVQTSGGSAVGSIPANAAADLIAVTILANTSGSWAVVPNAQIITLGGNLSGTSVLSGVGSQTLTATIASLPADIVTVGAGGSMKTIAANSVLANATASAAAPTAYAIATGYVLGNISGTLGAVQATATKVASTVVARDAGSNIYVNRAAEALNAPGATIVLDINSAPVQYYSSATAFNVTLPNAMTLIVGTRFTVINDGTGAITVRNATPTTIAVLNYTMRASFVLQDISTAAGVWLQTAGSLIPPTRLYSNGYATIGPGAVSITTAQLYNGPLVSSNGNTTTVTMPTYTTFMSEMGAILGYTPPNGFNFRTQIVCGNTRTITLSAPDTSVIIARANGNSYTTPASAVLLMEIWINTTTSKLYVSPSAS